MKIVIDRDAVEMYARMRPGLVKLDQGALAAAMGINRSHVWRLLAGEHTPNDETLGALASALGVPADKAKSALLKVITDEAEA